MGNKGSPIVSFLPFRQISPASHLPFIPFADIPSVQFTTHLAHRFFIPFAAIPFDQSVYFFPFTFRSFCRYPFESVGNHDGKKKN